VQATSKTGLGETLDNQRIMKLVEEALRQPENERRHYLKQECGSQAGDFEAAWHYVEWEQKMQGFLLDPVIKRDDGEELKIAEGDVLQERFRIVREVAQGGMGVVYEARDEKLGRRIALKCAKAGFGNELPPEVRHATEVSHPNVCKIYEIHTTRVKQQLVDFITMEYLEGETLSSRLRGGKMQQDEAVTIARQLAAGLAAAHHNGVIHGDIKSNNVVLTKANDGALRAVITDFGLARMQGTAKQGVWGTPGYMAPELWVGEAPSVASDLYALGIVFYEMATGEIPDRSHTSQALSQTLKATPWLEVARQKPPSVNAYWDRILGRCLDPEPNRRYKTTDQLAAALQPGHARRNALLAVAAGLAISLTGVITYKIATAPAETVKLAVVAEGGAPLGDAEAEIGRLQGTKKTGFVLLDAREAEKATHLLRVSTTKQGGQTAVHAVLSDAQSQSAVKIWDGVYAPGEWKYVGSALAGVVSAGLHLTPLPESDVVNDRATHDYVAGVQAVRQDSTLEEGLRDLERASAADPGSAVVWAALAKAAFAQYDRTKDKKFLGEANEAERQSELRYLDTGIGHRAAADLDSRAGRFEDQVAQLLRAIELEPANASNYLLLGDAYKKTNQFDLELRAFRRAVELEPASYENQLRLGEFYLDQSRSTEAVKHLAEAVKLAPSLPAVRFPLAEAYTDTGQFDKAMETLRALKEWHADEHYQVAAISMYQRKDQEAIPQLLSAIQEKPSVAHWFLLTTAYRRTGQMAQSKLAAQSGLKLAEHKLMENPNDRDERAFLGYFCARLGQAERAETETKQAVVLGPHQLDVIWVAVATYEILGKRDEAIAILRASAPREMLDDLKRWPDMADFTADSRFIELTATDAEKKDKRQ